MEQKLIEGTGLVSSRIALGTWSIGGWMWGGSDEGEAIKTIRTALDLGITLIDTAPAYGFGRSEELVGRAIAEHGGRERVLIATKAGLEWRAGQVYRNASAERIRAEVKESLRRLENRLHRHLPGALARSPRCARRNRRGASPALRGGNDPRHRCEQLLSRTDGDLPGRRAAARPAAALQPLRARDREGRPSVCRAARPHRLGIRRALPGLAIGPHAIRHAVHRR